MNRLLLPLSVALCLALSVSCDKQSSAGNDQRLWYDTPASCWLEALPLGNSKMGAMVFGGTDVEEIGLNEETFWSGRPHNNNSPEAYAYMDEIRRLVLEGREGFCRRRAGNVILADKRPLGRDLAGCIAPREDVFADFLCNDKIGRFLFHGSRAFLRVLRAFYHSRLSRSMPRRSPTAN